ncbi:MAG: hypothetical protein FWB86_13690 [Treponema sp.]|nr:hypothetical protein [Treponema sp.]MCL2252399.1 hypothetical protein [Treponema sp.]
MKTKLILAFCFSCAIIALMFTACNRGSNNKNESEGQSFPHTQSETVVDVSKDVNFSVHYIQNIDMSRLANRNIIRHEAAHNGEKIIISADVDLHEFKIYSIGIDDEDFTIFIENTVYSLDVLKSNSAIEYSTYIPDGIPAEALSFKTPDGTTHAYILGVSGMDGTVVLLPWSIPSQSEYPTQTALEHEELRIGSSVSGVVGRDWKEKYNIRSFEKGNIILKIDSDVEIYLEVYNGQQFITSNINDSDEISSRAEISAQPNTVYLLTVQSYVRDVTEAAFRITASFDH